MMPPNYIDKQGGNELHITENDMQEFRKKQLGEK